MLGGMGIDRHIPFIRQGFECAHVIEMRVRHHNACRPAVCPKPRPGGAPDCRGRAGNSGIDQNPIPVTGLLDPDEDDVDDCQLPVCNVGNDLTGVVVAVEVGLRALGGGPGREWYLRHVGFSCTCASG
jgi:hypothetical protein